MMPINPVKMMNVQRSARNTRDRMSSSMYPTGLERSATLLILEAGHLLSGEVRGADQSRMLQHRFESATHPKVDFGDDLGLQRIVSRLYLYTPDQPVATGRHET